MGWSRVREDRRRRGGLAEREVAGGAAAIASKLSRKVYLAVISGTVSTLRPNDRASTAKAPRAALPRTGTRQADICIYIYIYIYIFVSLPLSLYIYIYIYIKYIYIYMYHIYIYIIYIYIYIHTYP